MNLDSGQPHPYVSTLDRQPAAAIRKHSELGIASFALAIVAGMAAFTLIVAAGVMETSTPGGIDDQSPLAIVLGLCLFAVVGLNLVGLGLGIAGLVQANRLRTFAVLGLVFNFLVILGLGGLMAIGLAMGA